MPRSVVGFALLLVSLSPAARAGSLEADLRRVLRDAKTPGAAVAVGTCSDTTR
jgi:hypothetical protein